MARVLQTGMISAAALPPRGQTATNAQAEAKPRSFGAAGRLPVCSHTRVRLFLRDPCPDLGRLVAGAAKISVAMTKSHFRYPAAPRSYRGHHASHLRGLFRVGH